VKEYERRDSSNDFITRQPAITRWAKSPKTTQNTVPYCQKYTPTDRIFGDFDWAPDGIPTRWDTRLYVICYIQAIFPFLVRV